jgi:hypothetical protein
VPVPPRPFASATHFFNLLKNSPKGCLSLEIAKGKINHKEKITSVRVRPHFVRWGKKKKKKKIEKRTQKTKQNKSKKMTEPLQREGEVVALTLAHLSHRTPPAAWLAAVAPVPPGALVRVSFLGGSRLLRPGLAGLISHAVAAGACPARGLIAALASRTGPSGAGPGGKAGTAAAGPNPTRAETPAGAAVVAAIAEAVIAGGGS